MGNCLSSSSEQLSVVAATTSGDTTKGGPQPEQPVPAAKPSAAPVITNLRDTDGNEQLGADYDRNTLEETDYESTEATTIGPYSSLQEELNELLEAVYAVISEEDIQKYQQYLDAIQKQQIAERAIKALTKAPGFTLLDQDNEQVSLEALCAKGPVVLQFYRGKVCHRRDII